jgi:hypothetical protein
MKRLMTIALALSIASFAFGQKKTANNTSDYKHPFAKENKAVSTETFSTETVSEGSDYKHDLKKKNVKRVRVRTGNGGNAAASHKHPLG